MIRIIARHIRHWSELLRNKKYRISLLLGFIWLIAALYVNYLISNFNETFVATGAGDLILDNIPTLDLNYFYTVGIYVIIVSLFVYIFFRPEIAPFAFKTYAIFILVRSFFIVLTHIGPPPGFYDLAGPGQDSPFLQKFFFINDLFFSAHTGIPFLGFLLFRGSVVRYFYLVASFVMGATVLLMHVHYSIDVFGAYFITYSIYHLSDNVFHKLNNSFKRLLKLIEKREEKFRQTLKNQFK